MSDKVLDEQGNDLERFPHAWLEGPDDRLVCRYCELRPNEVEPDADCSRRNKRGALSGPNPTSFKPGVSGNPAGRPRGRVSITAHLFRILADDTDALAEALAKVAINEAVKGNFRFFKEIVDRLEGKVPDRHEISGPQGDPIEIDAARITDILLADLESSGEVPAPAESGETTSARTTDDD